jgi:hypothetical protein
VKEFYGGYKTESLSWSVIKFVLDVVAVLFREFFAVPAFNVNSIDGFAAFGIMKQIQYLYLVSQLENKYTSC